MLSESLFNFEHVSLMMSDDYHHSVIVSVV